MLYALAPQSVDFVAVPWPWRVLPVDLERFVHREIESVQAIVNKSEDILQAIYHAFLEQIEYVERRFQVALSKGLIQAEPVLFVQRLDILGKEVRAIRIKPVEVLVEDLGRHAVVDLSARIVVIVAQFVDDGDRGLGMRRQRRQRLVDAALGLRRV